MSKFEMRPRPRKPTQPKHVTFEVGSRVTLGYLHECVEKFKTENPGRSEQEIMLSIEQEGYSCDSIYSYDSIYLNAPPESHRGYEKKLEAYQIELKSYKMWQGKYEVEIGRCRAAEKKKVAKRKLKRTEDRLIKEMAAVKAKLEKA